MAQNFLSCGRDQDFLMAPSVREWLPAGHLVWSLLDVVERLDLDAIYGEYRVDGSGRAAHDPGMMVALLLYAYAVGERSSRQIERRCVEDVAFRVVAANRAPDHSTIARFRVRHARRLADLFVQVLALCAKARMVRVGTVAVDGSKLAANAGLSANRCYPAIREEVERILAEADAVDAAEDEQFGAARGDELPPELADPASRRARLDRAKRELEAEQAAREAEFQARMAARERHRERTGSYPPGRPPKPLDPAELEAGKRNITDPDSRIMSARGAHVQAYNAQALVGEGRVILAAEVTNSGADSNQLQRMVARAREPRRDRARRPDQVRAGRRRLLEPRRDRRRPGHHRGGGHPHQRPPQLQAHARPQARPPGRADQQDPRHPRRPTPLPPPRRARRTRLRAHQTHPRHRPLQPPRDRRRPGRMAADRHHPQPPQALAPQPHTPLTKARPAARGTPGAAPEPQQPRTNPPRNPPGPQQPP